MSMTNASRSRSLRDVAISQNRDKLLHNRKTEATEKTIVIMGSKSSASIPFSDLNRILVCILLYDVFFTKYFTGENKHNSSIHR